MAESEVDRDLRRTVDEAEQAMAHRSRFVEPVHQNACAELGTSTTGRRHDVHDQRNATGVEICRHHRASSLLVHVGSVRC